MLPNEKDEYGVSSMAEATKWVSVVTSVVGVMIIPALGGMWIDNLLGTKCLFVILGAIFGFVGGMYCLLGMMKASKAEIHQSRKPFPSVKERSQKSTSPLGARQ